MFRKRIVLCCAALCLTVTAGISLTACQNKSTDRSTSSENQDSISIESTSDDLGKYSVRISIGNAMDHPQAVGLTAMKEYVEEKTGGNVVIKIFPNSQLGAERESVEQVKSGSLEMATAAFGPLTTFNHKFYVFDIPFMFDNYEEAWALLDSEKGMEILGMLEESGIKCMAPLENGFRHVTNNIRPITKPDDLKGLKIRTMEAPMHIANFQALGANPTPIPWSELYLAMQQKIVDGQENPLVNVEEVKMYEVQKYLSTTSHLYDCMVLVTNADWFNNLPEEYQQILADGAEIAKTVSRESNQELEQGLLKSFEEQGMEVNELSPDDIEAFRSISQPVVIDAVKKELNDDAFVDDFLASVQEIKHAGK